MANKYINDNGLKALVKKIKTWCRDLFNPMEDITYTELKALRDASKLVVGRRYRITDFVTTSVQEDTRSAGHAFDVIVTADDVNVLNENAKAIQHKGDTYFAGCKLSAWELKYCLDNDTDRFAWADTTNGKGVIWWMKDEWDNECFYDFKNIQYKRYKVTGASETKYETKIAPFVYSDEEGDEQPYYYGIKDNATGNVFPQYAVIDENSYEWFFTFSARVNQEFIDASLRETLTEKEKTDIANYGANSLSVVHSCKLGKNTSQFLADDYYATDILTLNNGVIYNEISLDYDEEGDLNDIIGGFAYRVTCGNSCNSWTCGNGCYSWTCGNSCSSWTCGNYCSSWTCGNNCSSWTCGNYCSSWTCGNNCSSWTCGNYCYSWTCGNSCSSWTCGNNCYSWTCGNSCRSWTCGNNCNSWTCGNNCNSWTCGNSCYSWTCGNSCNSWTCGNGCYYWTCGNSCYSWTCGNGCYYWTCGNEVSGTKVLQDYVSYFKLENGVSNVTIKSSGTTTSGTPLKNFVIKSGVKGASNSNKLAITINTTNFPLNSNYEWIIAKNSSGEVKQYCEADLIN